jgi:SPOR domain
MADDNILRSYRSNDLARRVSAPAAPRDAQRDAPRDAGGSDPLAELARLIGQSDPFADFDRNGGHASEPRPRADFAPSDWRKTAAALARDSMRNPPAPDPHFDEVDGAISAAKSLRAPPDDPFARLASHVSQHPLDHATPDRAAFDHAAYDQAAVPQAGYADAAYDEPRVASHADDQFDDSRHTEAPPDVHESENYFFDGAPAPTDDHFYDDPPRRRATNGIVTAIVLVGCGILGTAGAYGYRTYYTGARPTDAPIISAEKSPNKMVPAAGGGDSQSGKSVERIGAANERVVARQEEPVTLSDPNGPRVVLPAPFTTTPGPGPLAQPNAALPAGAPTEPKKVRTVAIRPDGAADPMMVRPVSGAGSAPLQTASAPANAATRQPPATKPVPAPAHNGGGPLSLEPQGQIGDSASSYQAAPQQHPAPPPASAPRLASVSPPASGGGYVVQISSQRSEADAQASFRNLQSKFPSQLGDREAIVRRADLGPKGVYYRAMVGPFGSAGDADQFCGGLKAAGGQCIVQKN